MTSYKEKISREISKYEDFKMTVGRGVSSVINGKKVFAGNSELLKENDISVCVNTEISQFYTQGSTVIYIGIDGEFTGYIVLSDVLRNESSQMITKLSELGVMPVLLTGDNKNAAESIAKTLHISEYRSECLPEDKLKYIDKSEKENKLVCMIGDGINDAPALKRATLGIAMGGIGSDIAVDAADIVLVDDEVKELPHLVALSKRMMTTIKLNMTFSMCLNFVAIILAIIGTLNPIVGALVHNVGSVLVIINSSLLLKWRKK